MSIKYGLPLAAKEHMLSGEPLTRLEAILLFGVQNLTTEIHRWRRAGWVIRSRKVPYALALKRLNETFKVQVPDNLPVREIMLTEYWISI